MWNRTSQKKPTRKTGRRGTKKKKVSVARIMIAFSILFFFLFTVGAVGYVIFFRTVLA